MVRFMVISTVIFVLSVTTHSHPLNEYKAFGLDISWQIDVPSITGNEMSVSQERNGLNGAKFMDNTHFLIPQQIDENEVFNKFVTYKKTDGSETEKKYYQNKEAKHIIQKCIEKRAVSFFDATDFTLLRDTNGYAFHLDWTLIGNDEWEKETGSTPFVVNKIMNYVEQHGDTAKKNNWQYNKVDVCPAGVHVFDNAHITNIITNFKIANYLSYDEIMLCALLTVAGPTQFYNDGSRRNFGKVQDGYPIQGYIAGAVGPRFELEGKMEYSLMINNPPSNPKMAEIIFGGVDAKYEKWGDMQVNVGFLRARYEMTYRTYLRWASVTLQENPGNKKGYFSITGLGAGVWALKGFDSKQSQMIVDVVYNLIGTELKGVPSGSIVDFTFFPWVDYKGIVDADDSNKIFPLGENRPPQMSATLKHKELDIEIRFSANSPSSIDKKNADYEIFELYAYDGNSAPGNEVHVLGAKNNPNYKNDYWLWASGDPAAALSSDIMWTQSAITNKQLATHYMVYSDESNEKVTTRVPFPAKVGGRRLAVHSDESNKVGPTLQTLVVAVTLVVTLIMSYFFFYH